MKEQLIIFDTTMRDGEQSPGRVDDAGRKAAHRAPARAHARGRHRGRISRRERRRFRGGEGGRAARSRTASSAGWRAPTRTTSAAAARRCGTPAMRRACTPSSRPRRSTWRRSCAWSPSQVIEQAVRAVKLGARVHRQRRVLARGRGPLGHRFPLPHPRAGDQGRRADHQRAGHRRLHAARAVRRA